jgi:hypothetical protein
MTEATSTASGAKTVSDAAALSLIDIGRIDRAAGKSAKRGDLTDKLKRQANGRAPPPSAPAIVAPEAPAIAPTVAPAPPVAPLAASTHEPTAAPVMERVAPLPELPVALDPPAPPSVAPDEVPLPEASVAPEPAPSPVTRYTAPLPEPYFAPEPSPPPVTRRAIALPEPYVARESSWKPEVQPTYSAAAPEASRAAPLSYDDLRSTDDLIYYWDELRDGRELPLFSNLDRTRIAISWPDTVMVNYDDEDRAAVPQIARLSRLTGVVEFTSMVTEWILSSSRQVARAGKAMETKRAFTGANAARSYHMLLLPFANPGGASDHVLCHLSSAD